MSKKPSRLRLLAYVPALTLTGLIDAADTTVYECGEKGCDWTVRLTGVTEDEARWWQEACVHAVHAPRG